VETTSEEEAGKVKRKVARCAIKYRGKRAWKDIEETGGKKERINRRKGEN